MAWHGVPCAPLVLATKRERGEDNARCARSAARIAACPSSVAYTGLLAFDLASVQRDLRGVGVHVGVHAVIQDEVELVVVAELGYRLGEHVEGIYEAEPPTLTRRRLVNDIHQKEQDALRVGLTQLTPFVSPEQSLVKEDAIVDECPAAPRDIGCQEGMAVGDIERSAGSLANVRL